MSIRSDSESYCSTSEYSIYLGLCLEHKYILIREIEQGSNAYFWICYSVHDEKYLAMKIQYSKYYSNGCREVSILSAINDFVKKEQEETHCIELITHFVYSIEDRKYVCSVYPLYHTNVYILIFNGHGQNGLSISLVKNITRKLLESLVILHENLNIIHADLKPENILIDKNSMENEDISEIFDEENFRERLEEISSIEDRSEYYKKLDEIASLCILYREYDECYCCDEPKIPNTEQRKRRQSVDDTKELSDKLVDLDQSTYYDFQQVIDKEDNLEESTVDCEIAVIDFGSALYYSTRTTDEIQYRLYRAPEIILNLDYDYSCDIWSVGCIVYELVTGYPLFNPKENNLNQDLNHLFLMEKFLGPIPIEMKQKSRRSEFLFDKKRTIIFDR
jgi:serine/threonine protein kinase